MSEEIEKVASDVKNIEESLRKWIDTELKDFPVRNVACFLLTFAAETFYGNLDKDTADKQIKRFIELAYEFSKRP